jgi:hypothetical protein
MRWCVQSCPGLSPHHELGKRLLAAVNAHLQAQGIKIADGTIVDATISSAPSSTRAVERGLRALRLARWPVTCVPQPLIGGAAGVRSCRQPGGILGRSFAEALDWASARHSTRRSVTIARGTEVASRQRNEAASGRGVGPRCCWRSDSNAQAAQPDRKCQSGRTHEERSKRG